MDAQELRNLQEAYMEVVENQQLDEGMTMKDFKQQRSRQKQKEKRAAEKTSPTRRANMSSYERAVRHRVSVDPDYDRDHEERDYPGGVTKNPKKIRKAKALGELGEQNDIYDIILSHLLDEGYAETQEAAEAIMVNMSEDWRDSIVEEMLDEGEKPFPYEKVKAKQVALRDKGSAGLERRMKMGAAVRRAKEAEKTGGSQQDAGKGWYHGR